MTIHAILWRNLETPGHDAAHLVPQSDGWQLTGAALFRHAQSVCRLDYHILCDPEWQTRLARVTGWVGAARVDLTLTVDGDQRWRLNDVAQPAVAGCLDVDLNFTPATNTLAIRRLDLAVGQGVDVTAAWLRFPELTLEPLPQRYTRLDDRRYHYESDGGSFVAELAVDAVGFVTDYPQLWQAETGG
jgi:hypothetical protein